MCLYLLNIIRYLRTCEVNSGICNAYAITEIIFVV